MTGIAVVCILIIATVVLGAVLYQRAIAPAYPRARYASAVLAGWVVFVAWLALGYPPVGCLGVGMVVPLFGDAFYRTWTIRVYGLPLYQERLAEVIQRGGAWAFIRQLLWRQAIHSTVPLIVLVLSEGNTYIRMLAVGMLVGLGASAVATVRLALRPVGSKPTTRAETVS